MNIHFRPARSADTEAAVPLIYSSGPAAFDYVFAGEGRSAQTFLLRAFADGAGEFGHGNHVVGEVDGKLVAAGAGFDRRQMTGFTRAAARQILAHYGLRAAGPIVRGLRTEQVIRPPRDGEFYLGHLGVDPAYRGQGVGAQLVAWLLERGRQRGCRCAVLDVAEDNPRAQALYQRLGFEVTGQRAARLINRHGRVPAQTRMQQNLQTLR